MKNRLRPVFYFIVLFIEQFYSFLIIVSLIYHVILPLLTLGVKHENFSY